MLAVHYRIIRILCNLELCEGSLGIAEFLFGTVVLNILFKSIQRNLSLYRSMLTKQYVMWVRYAEICRVVNQGPFTFTNCEKKSIKKFLSWLCDLIIYCVTGHLLEKKKLWINNLKVNGLIRKLESYFFLAQLMGLQLRGASEIKKLQFLHPNNYNHATKVI